MSGVVVLMQLKLFRCISNIRALLHQHTTQKNVGCITINHEFLTPTGGVNIRSIVSHSLKLQMPSLEHTKGARWKVIRVIGVTKMEKTSPKFLYYPASQRKVLNLVTKVRLAQPIMNLIFVDPPQYLPWTLHFL